MSVHYRAENTVLNLMRSQKKYNFESKMTNIKIWIWEHKKRTGGLNTKKRIGFGSKNQKIRIRIRKKTWVLSSKIQIRNRHTKLIREPKKYGGFGAIRLRGKEDQWPIQFVWTNESPCPSR